MKIICHLLVVLAVFVTVSHTVKEKSEHGHQKHFDHGEHNPHHDHEAILGNYVHLVTYIIFLLYQ